MQFKSPTETTVNEEPINEFDLIGIGRFAGIFMPTITADSTIWFYSVFLTLL